MSWRSSKGHNTFMLKSTYPPWQKPNPRGTAAAAAQAAPPPSLNLGTYNIRDGQGFGLPQEIQAVQIRNYNLMLLTEVNIMYEV